MRMFDNYLTGLDSVLSKKVKVTPDLIAEQKRFNLNPAIQKAQPGGPMNAQALPTPLEGPKVLFNYDRTFLEMHFGINTSAFQNITIGPHPDFSDLKQNSYLNHHCVSVFVDIKGSTRLIEKYSLLEVRLIKDSLLTLAIQVANQFGGHIHRLQGDGIFIQFVRRNRHENDAIINSLNAASILAQFVSIDLAGIMSQYGLRPLKIRVGIDFGNDENVLWSHYGIPGCGELTTTSLHTDMAAKLQGKAYDNSILIGGNIKSTLDLKSDFFSVYENQESKEKVYYISNTFTYPFYVFEWQEYLGSLPFFFKKTEDQKLEVREKQIWIDCYISNEDGSEKEKYYPNSRSIPKNKKISYTLMRLNSPYVMQSYEKIEWYAFNSGKEADSKQQLRHDFGKEYHNKNYCNTMAAYLGHHHVECKIIRDHSASEKITFPIFVR